MDVFNNLTTVMFSKALLMVTEMRKNPNPKTGEWLSELWYICTTAFKNNAGFVITI